MMEKQLYIVDVATFGGTRRYRVEAWSELRAEAIAARYGIVLSIVEAE
jgi:hypothetical protein